MRETSRDPKTPGHTPPVWLRHDQDTPPVRRPDILIVLSSNRATAFAQHSAAVVEIRSYDDAEPNWMDKDGCSCRRSFVTSGKTNVAPLAHTIAQAVILNSIRGMGISRINLVKLDAATDALAEAIRPGPTTGRIPDDPANPVPGPSPTHPAG